ncbi:hypothetical protein BsWGS_17583 [Bradybaena similaris]
MKFSDEGRMVDEVLMSLRWWGPYQQVQFLLLMLQILSCGFHAMSFLFLGKSVEHKCAALANLSVPILSGDIVTEYDVISNHSGLNLTVTYGACNIQVRNGTEQLYTTTCVAGYEYAEPIDRSYVSQFDLVCDREAFSDFSQTMLALGMMIGAFMFTALADKYGRKATYMASHLLLLVVAVAIAFSPNFTVYVVLRFLLGAVQQGTALISSIMLIEMLPKEKRALPTLVGNFVWVGSLMLLCLVAYLCHDISWRYTELILAASSVYVLFQWWITDESLRWLVTNKRHVDIQRVLKKASRANKVDVQTILALLNPGPGLMAPVDGTVTSLLPPHVNDGHPPNDSKVTVTNKADESVKTHNNLPDKTSPKEEMRLMAFIKNKRVLMTTLISCYMWLTASITYYGLLMMSTSLTDSLYLGVFLSVVAELPTAFIYILAIDRLGRKRFLIGSQILAGVSLLAATVLANVPIADNIPGIGIIIISVTILGKFAVSTAFAILWLYSAELYPTNLRNTGFGISSLAARVGGMIAPYSRTFSRYVPWGPGAVFTALCLLVPVMLRFLPETTGRELPQTLADFERMYEPVEKPSVPEKAKKSMPC